MRPPVVASVALLYVLALAHVADAFMNFNQQCPGFKCASPKQVAVPKKDFVFTSNGCGTAALPIQTETDFSECCNWHDVCYSTCGMKKSTCEKRLDKCMRDTCATLTATGEREKCDSTAKLFALGAQMVACPAYQQAQREACQCVAKAKVEHAHRQRLMYFLDQNNALEIDRKPQAVEQLLAKYKGQEPKMFLRLLKKYPGAIKQDASKKNFMEDIFKAPGGEHELDGATFPKKDTFSVGLEEENEGDATPRDDHIDEHIEL